MQESPWDWWFGPVSSMHYQPTIVPDKEDEEVNNPLQEEDEANRSRV